ncbi:MAG TPA: hypothetical protein VLF95_07805 [Vicinamibacteria bacterium]|nr:hypothetical protein [Vicinamibacteria bacterium]
MTHGPHASARGASSARAAAALASLAVFVCGLALMSGLQARYRPFAEDGIHFQEHSSEDMMQTVSLLDLRERPVETLLAVHIQPPLLDTVRAALARLWPTAGRRALVLQVDRGLYLVWMLVYAAMAALVFHWLRQLLAGTRVAALAALAFLFHPAAIFYGTYLEGTLLTSFGILWLCYALWRVPARGATLSLGAAYLLLFSVRSIFQWPALLVLVAALLLCGAPRRSLLAFALPCTLVVGAFMLKQYLVFRSTSTSSFAGSSCLQALGEVPEMGVSSPVDTPLGPLLSRVSSSDLPRALTRETKIGGAHNFNHLADLANERRLARRCWERLRSVPLRGSLGAWSANVAIFLQPSSRYVTPHLIVDRLPWRGAYDWVFSGCRLLVLLAAGVLLWARRRTGPAIRRGLGLALPVLFVSAACVMFERDENMRYKFFVEPVLYVFLVAQAVALARRRPRTAFPAATAAAEPSP